MIRNLNAELELLGRQIATRKPPGGRAPTPDHVVERIECEIEAGGSNRGIAMRYGVSHMTVHRIRNRMRARERVVSA